MELIKLWEIKRHGAKAEIKRVPEVMRKWQEWLYKRLGRQDYTSLSGGDCLRFSDFSTVKRNIRQDREAGVLLPKYKIGINEEIIEGFAVKRFGTEWTSANGDGTRGKRAWVRMGMQLVGGEYHADVARWEDTKVFVPESKADLVRIIFITRRLKMLSSEIYTEQLRCLTNRSKPSLSIAIIPEASRGNTGFGLLQYWFKLMDILRKAGVNFKDFCTDMCSVGLSAAQLLCRPSESMASFGCSYVGLPVDDYPFFDVFCQPSVPAGGGDPAHIPLPVGWAPDNPHLIRLARNLLDRLAYIVFFCVQRGSLRGCKVSCFDKLRELSTKRCAFGMQLKEIVTICSYADQKNDSAYRMCSMDVIELLQTHHPEDTATILALESFHFLAEAYRNENFSNPHLLVQYVWRAAAVWEMQERYIKKVANVDRPSDCIPSYQFRIAIQMAACKATNYALTYHLRGIDEEKKWEDFNIAELNQDELEGTHSCGRAMVGKQGGANDQNFTVAGWCDIQDSLQTMADCKRYVEEEGGVKFGAPRHTEKTHRREFTMGHHGGDNDFSKSWRKYLPPKEYKDFVEDLIEARESSYEWARNRMVELFGPCYADQCRDANQWEQRTLVPERDSWLRCGRLYPDCMLDLVEADSKVAVELRARDIVELPQNFKMVLDGIQDVTVPASTLSGRLVVPEAVKKKHAALDAELKAAAKLLKEELGEDGQDGQVQPVAGVDAEPDEDEIPGLMEELQALKEKAAAFRDDQECFGSDMAAKKQSKSSVCNEEGGHFDLAGVLSGKLVKDDDGSYVSSDQVVTKYQRPDRVDRDRCRRFIKFVLGEWDIAMREGHDVTLGSCMCVWWGGTTSFAVVRVLKMYSEEGQVRYSLKLQKKCKKQQFRVELLEPAGQTEAGSQRYRSSGWQVGPVGAAMVIGLVDLLKLDEVWCMHSVCNMYISHHIIVSCPPVCRLSAFPVSNECMRHFFPLKRL